MLTDIVGLPDNVLLFAYEPLESLYAFQDNLARKAKTTNSWSYTILANTAHGPNTPVGMASLMRMDLDNRAIKVRSTTYMSSMQRTPAATEAMHLLVHCVFETLGFRKYQRECNSLNEPSKHAPSDWVSLTRALSDNV